MLGLRRQLHYLVSRERRGCQTAYDEVARSDVDAFARAIHLVPENEVPLSTPHSLRWYRCTICSQSTQHAIVCNRLLSHWDVQRLLNDPPPVHSWRCEAHRRYKMRPASAIWVNKQAICALRWSAVIAYNRSLEVSGITPRR